MIVLICQALFCQSGFGQSDNFRAQGYYYKAKELYQGKNYSAALPYLVKARDALSGSNVELQYLFIMAYVGTSDWISANKELKKYFDLIEDREKAVTFSKSVEELTDDETRSLTKAMVDIEEHAAYDESPEAKKEKILNEINIALDNLIDRDYNLAWGEKSYLNEYCETKKMKLTRSGYSFKYYEVYKEIDGRRNNPEYSMRESTVIFNLEDIDYIKYYNGGDVYYIDDNHISTAGNAVPSILVYFTTSLNCKKKQTYRSNATHTSEFGISQIRIKLDNDDQALIARVNELLSQYKND